jgi:hypothetical protein
LAVAARSDGRVETEIEIKGRDFEESFTSVDDFIVQATPEAFRAFTEIHGSIRTPSLNTTLQLSRSPRFHRPRTEDGVLLTVRGEESCRDEVAAVASNTAATVRRGYRSWWGDCDGSAATEVHRGANMRLKDLFEFSVTVAAGLVMGLGLVLAADAVAPEFQPPTVALAAFVVALWATYGSMFRRTVPSIEVQLGGTSTLTRAFRWTGLVLLSVALTGVAGRLV